MRQFRHLACLQAVDRSTAGLRELQQQCADHGSQLLTVQCDLHDDASQAEAFKTHYKKWGSLDFALLNAGITESGTVAPAPRILSLRASGPFQCAHRTVVKSLITDIPPLARGHSRCGTSALAKGKANCQSHAQMVPGAGHCRRREGASEHQVPVCMRSGHLHPCLRPPMAHKDFHSPHFRDSSICNQQLRKALHELRTSTLLRTWRG